MALSERVQNLPNKESDQHAASTAASRAAPLAGQTKETSDKPQAPRRVISVYSNALAELDRRDAL
jgi:hypothetical protein